MRLSITPLVAQDLEEIGDYIAQDNPLRAVDFLTALQSHCETILRNPEGYRLRHELSKTKGSCSHGNYVIFLSQTSERSASYVFCMVDVTFSKFSTHRKSCALQVKKAPEGLFSRDVQ
jgi:toxin ParE1/3/4